MIPLANETGEFLLGEPLNSGYSPLCFRGDLNFLNRCQNLFINYGIMNSGKFNRFTEGAFYFFAPLERIKSGLIEYFVGEIIHEKEQSIKYVCELIETEEEFRVEVKWDEEKVRELAINRMTNFLENVVIRKNFLNSIYFDVDFGGEEYKLGLMRNLGEE